MHRTSTHGAYRLDRVFPGVGRIAVASGAMTREEFNNRNALLTRLYGKGRLDLLVAIKTGMYNVTEVYAADREDQLGRLTGERAILNRPRWAVEQWIGRPLWGEGAERYDGVEPDHTRKRYAVSFKALKKRSELPDSATIESLHGVDWMALKPRWRSNADWNHLRRAARTSSPPYSAPGTRRWAWTASGG